MRPFCQEFPIHWVQQVRMILTLRMMLMRMTLRLLFRLMFMMTMLILISECALIPPSSWNPHWFRKIQTCQVHSSQKEANLASHLRKVICVTPWPHHTSKANCADDNCIDDDADDFTTCSDSLKSRSLPLILQESEFWQVISKWRQWSHKNAHMMRKTICKIWQSG